MEPIRRSLMVKNDSFEWNGWHILTRKGPIMGHKEGETLEQTMSLPHLPDMLFHQNVVRFTRSSPNAGQDPEEPVIGLELNPVDALATVNDHEDLVHVATAKEWMEARKDSPHIQKVIKPYDWTYTPKTYKGTLLGGGQIRVEPSSTGIDYEKLKEREKILFFDEVILYEDELDDNGCSLLTTKLRVMPSGFFCLLRFYLRVDNTLIRVIDNRFHYEAGQNYILREYSFRESKFTDLQIPMSVRNDPNEVGQHLKLVDETKEKLIWPASS
ncbi:TIP41-like protein [Tigriopus californicus]|uniref:TIP41-like protein n=1 Tax=Tigriopus californicus TaxID=6832 RepID=UPI0027DA0097|nr:TIP41-like protein [Tigriopus californicus]